LEKYQLLYGKKIFNPKNIRTFHSLAKYITKSRKSDLNMLIYQTNEFINEFNLQQDADTETHEKCFNQIAGMVKNISLIIVDEAQDLSEVQYEFVIKLREICKCSVVMVGDPD
jgi:ATP-dependent exoDNAse (exonuclease V) beta subunit